MLISIECKSTLNFVLDLAYLAVGDYNIIGVDWSELARAPFYLSAATNTRYVGKATALLVDFLVRQGASLDSMHLLGFSLGAHAAGWAGSSLTTGQLARITGNLKWRMVLESVFEVWSEKPPFFLALIDKVNAFIWITFLG